MAEVVRSRARSVPILGFAAIAAITGVLAVGASDEPARWRFPLFAGTSSAPPPGSAPAADLAEAVAAFGPGAVVPQAPEGMQLYAASHSGGGEIDTDGTAVFNLDLQFRGSRGYVHIWQTSNTSVRTGPDSPLAPGRTKPHNVNGVTWRRGTANLAPDTYFPVLSRVTASGVLVLIDGTELADVESVAAQFTDAPRTP